MDRRTLIKRGLFGGAVLAAAGALPLALSPTRIVHRPRRGLKVLDDTRFAILSAVSARTVSVEGADPAEIAHRVDETLDLMSPEVQADFRQLLMTLESAAVGLLLDGRPRSFTALGPKDQDAALRSWRDSRLLLRRSGYAALRKLTLAAYYAGPESWAGVRYPGPPEISEDG